MNLCLQLSPTGFRTHYEMKIPHFREIRKKNLATTIRYTNTWTDIYNIFNTSCPKYNINCCYRFSCGLCLDINGRHLLIYFRMFDLCTFHIIHPNWEKHHYQIAVSVSIFCQLWLGGSLIRGDIFRFKKTYLPKQMIGISFRYWENTVKFVLDVLYFTIWKRELL